MATLASIVRPSSVAPQSQPADACLNCGASLAARYCAECGQNRNDHSRSVLGFAHEFLEHHLMLDSKMLRTAHALVLRPGSLTRAYIEGRRASYVSPFRLYVFMSFIFFLALYLSGLAVFQVTGRIDAVSFQSGESSPAKTAQPPGGDGNSLSFDKVRFFAPVQEGGVEISDQVKALVEHGDAGESARSIKTGEGFIKALQHPRLLNAVLDTWLPRLLVLLLPFVAMWLALFGWGSGLFYVDHLAFALHGQAFCFLLATIAIVARLWLPTLPVSQVLGVVALVWTVVAFRHVYRSGWFGTFFKIGFVGSVYVVSLAVDLALVLVWGLSEIPG